MKDYILTNNIQELRKKAGITQAQLANALDLSRQSIISMEKGNCTPSLCHAMRVAVYFDRPIEDIFKFQKNYNEG